MANAAALILSTLDRHMAGHGILRLMGGASLTLAYGLDRATEDVDLLLDDAEAQFLGEHCNFGDALERTNQELEPLGLYVSHIWGPEQQILTPEWVESCRPLTQDLGLVHLQLQTLGPLDIIVSKMARADEGDISDIRHLISQEHLKAHQVIDAVNRALVPEILREVFDLSKPRVLAVVTLVGT